MEWQNRLVDDVTKKNTVVLEMQANPKQRYESDNQFKSSELNEVTTCKLDRIVTYKLPLPPIKKRALMKRKFQVIHTTVVNN